MKRSEAIDLIVEILYSNPIAPSAIVAEDIIDALLSRGFLPPRIKLSLLDAYDNAWEEETNAYKP